MNIRAFYLWIIVSSEHGQPEMQQPKRDHATRDCSDNATSKRKNADTDAPSNQFMITSLDFEVPLNEGEIGGDDRCEGAGRRKSQRCLDHRGELNPRAEHEQARASDERRGGDPEDRKPDIRVYGVEQVRHEDVLSEVSLGLD